MARKIIGRIANTFGLDGSIKVNMETDHPEIRFAQGATVTVDGFGDFTVASLQMKNYATGRVRLAGLDDISQAGKMIGRDITAEVEPLPGTYFIDDLLHLAVLDPKGQQIATVSKVQRLADTDYLVLDSGRYIPFTIGRFVQEPDLEKRTITLTELGLEATK